MIHTFYVSRGVQQPLIGKIVELNKIIIKCLLTDFYYTLTMPAVEDREDKDMKYTLNRLIS